MPLPERARAQGKATSSARKKFVFLFHARARFQEEMGLIWPPLRHIPERVYEKISTKLTLPSLPFATVFMPDRPHEPAGSMVIVPLNSRQMMSSSTRREPKSTRPSIAR